MLKKLTKVLSLLLIFCLVVSMFPAAALADEGAEDPVVTEAPEETTPVVTPDPEVTLLPEQTPAPSDPPADTESTGGDDPAGDVSADDESADNDESGNYTLSNPDEGVAVTSLTMGTKPANGSTTGNPFVQGTGGSNSFRIPALVTLNNGTLVAAADARWNTTYDGGGLDTIVSYSTDKGASWNYTFANYLGDNGNTYNGSGSTAFIDPALATDGSTVYMLCDLYPYGVALNGSGNTAPDTAVGFNDDGTLKLAANGSSSYDHYLKDGQIYDSSNNAISGYTVDAYFNITGNGYDTNLFFSDSPYQVVRTGYLYLTKSTDSGKTWSAPTLIPNVKTSSEQVCLVGPGRGLVTDGKIIFPVYSYNGSSDSQRMGFIYSSNNGASWTRVDSSINWSSEAAVVELADGTLRFFYRNGTSALCYVDYSWENGWGSAVNTGIATNSNTQISAISYSKTVGGKQVILVSCPTGSGSSGSSSSSASARLNGKIFVGLVNSDNTMDWNVGTSVSLNSQHSSTNYFMYSCLTELSDGSVAILYEDNESAWGTGDDCYYQMTYATVAASSFGLTFDEVVDENIYVDDSDNNTGIIINFGSSAYESVNITKQENISALADKTYVAYDIAVTGFSGTSATVTIPLNGKFAADAKLYAVYINADGQLTEETFKGDFNVTADTFTFVATHFSTYAVLAEAAESELPAHEIEKDITLVVDGKETVTDETGNHESSYTGAGLNESIATVTVKGETTTIPGGTTTGLVTSLVDGNYIIGNGSQWLTLTNGTLGTTDTAANATEWTITASNGSYTIQSGSYYLGWTYTTSGTFTTTYTYTLSAVTSAASWSYNSSTGLYSNLTYQYSRWSGTTSSDYYLSYSNGWTMARNNASSYGRVYTRTTEAGGTTEKTTITFTGVTAGETQVIVGSTQYNITVTRKTETVDLTVGNTKTYTDASTKVSVSDNSVVSATLSNGSLSIQGLKDGTATVTTDTTVYKVTVSDGTPITIYENETTTISVTLEDGQTVKWSSADSSYVGVAGKYDTSADAYTNEAILAGQNVTSSPVTVTGTVYNADGTVAGVHKWLVTVKPGAADTNTSSKGIYFNIDTIENCTVYYSINGGELIPVNGTGVTTGNWTGNGTYTGHFNIMFFAAPDEGYALTYMYIEGTDGQYYTLSNGNNPDGTDSDAWPFIDPAQATIPTSNSDNNIWKTVNGSLHGFRWALLEGNMSIDQMKVLFSNAIALGCDGVTTQTKNSTDGIGSSADPMEVKFVAQKLPTVEKTITSITHDGTETAYTDDMTVEIGDTIKYSVVVTRYATNATYGTITYDNEKLEDTLTGNSGISNPDMGTSTTSDKIYTYTTSLTLTMDNFADVVKNGKITNTADFSYSYSSYYSAGSLETKASAVADITVKVPEYVIDFGLPVTIDLSSVLGGAAITGGTASYGTITSSGTSFTYTPDKVLRGVDYVTLTLGNNQTYGVNIYPATTVYYEEGFASYTGNWTRGSTGSGTQATQIAGQSSDEYGFDAKYANEATGPSNGTEAISSAISEDAVFTFTGTGVDIYANCAEGTGFVNILIRNASTNAIVRLLQVDTKTGAGSTATAGQNVPSYSLPIASVTGLEHGTYTITIRHGKTSADTSALPVKLDGFRVYGTLKEEPAFYANDAEDYPAYIELRDKVLAAQEVKVGEGDSQYASDIAEYALAQVYARVQSDEGSLSGAVILSNNTAYTQTEIQDLLDNGPKNEIFLRNNQSLVFTVKTSREVQIGLKAVDKGTTYTITGKSEPQSITSSTDMFYTVYAKGALAGTEAQTITITNTGNGILSITKLKICDDPGATLGELTEEDLIPALVSLGYELEPEEPEVQYADATLTVEVNGQTAVLTKNGVVGESATFTAAEVEAAAQGLVPEGYELKDQAEDVSVAYGASTTVSLRAEEIPTESEQPEEPEQPTEPEKPEEPSKPANIISTVISLINRIFGSLKGLFR